jgi:hypothetical protein
VEVRTTDARVRRLMEEMQRHGRMVPAPMRAGMDRKTAGKYGSCAVSQAFH